MNTRITAGRMRGFSLIEVMVALIIIAVGMLGIAKLQALALSTTESSGVRSLVAMEAASLAAEMHANRDYWAGPAGPPPPSFTVDVQTTAPAPALPSVTVTDSTGVLSATPNCASVTPCTAASVAAYDVQQWGAELGAVVPAARATVTCNLTATPLNCTIQILWQENVSSTSNSAAATSSSANALNSPLYTLYVEP